MDYDEAAGRLMNPETREAIQIVYDYVRKDFHDRGWENAINAVSKEVTKKMSLMYKDTKQGEYACREIGNLAKVICHLTPPEDK